MWDVEINKLTNFEKQVIVQKGTEKPFSGKYTIFNKDGVYYCKLCNAPLYTSEDKFDSECGWPSFDDAIKGAVKEKLDADGSRTEIVCARCDAHLGHVFRGEGLTDKNIRHCVNSISMNFKKKEDETDKNINYAYFAGGCFWGVEYLLEKIDGVIDVVSGYMGGKQENPTYQDVIYRNTGHLETVRVEYDSSKVSYETLARKFFEIHDPFQINGQGPDIGEQYISAIFINSKLERAIIEKLILILNDKNREKVATKILDMAIFYKAEKYHQNYYSKNGKTPYCHSYTRRF